MRFVRMMAAVCSLPALLAAQTAQPNIVLILADDLGIGDLGCYNAESKAPTPSLDRIAASGMRFTDMHSPSAVCTPARYGLLTGRYAWRSRLKRGVLNGYSPALLERGRMTLASMLKARGYATACAGKWHLGLGSRRRTDYSQPLAPGPSTAGFDWFYGIPASLDMTPYLWVANERPTALPADTIAKSAHRRRNGGGFWRGGAIAPGFRHADVLPVIGNKSVEWIEARAKETDRPFFLYVPLSAPHTPWLPSDEFRGKSEAGYYGDFVAMVDAVIGRIVRAIDGAGLTDDTLLIVTSDNGSHWPTSDIAKYRHRANLHFRGQKADIWEGGHRVPFLVRWPGRVAPRSVDRTTACLTDVLATVAAITGVELPDDGAGDSFDLSPAWLGTGTPERGAVVHHSANGTFAIRHGKWKLILGRGSGGFTAPRTIPPNRLGPDAPRGQLYDLHADPSERTNVWNERRDVVARLTALLARYRERGRSTPLRRSKPRWENASGGELRADQATFDVRHYDLALRVDPRGRAITGRLTMRAEVLEPTDRIALHLDGRLRIARIEQDIRKLDFAHEGGVVGIALGREAKPGETLQLTVHYGGRPRVAPRPPWDGGFTWAKTKAGEPWIATSCQGEGADLWWPCKDHPSDKPESMDLRITVPQSLFCASNGVLASQTTNDDDTRTFHWRVKNPISNYCVALNIAPYRIVEQSFQSIAGETMPVRFYCLPESYDNAKKLMPEILDHLQFFEDVCGPYPFRNEKYGVAETPHLGMEHQTIIAYGYGFKRHALGYDWLHHHELSHEWWGNLVTCRDWKDMWIHEGFGTYMQALYVERKRGPKGYRAAMATTGMHANRSPVAPRGVRDSKEIYFAGGGGNDIYYKGAWILHTLRWLIGDEKFFLTLRRMCYPTPAHERATDGSQVRLADTRDYIALVEEITGRDHGWFFDVYLRQPKLPRLVTEREDGALLLRWEAPGGRPFPMPVPVEVDGRIRRVAMPRGEGRVDLGPGSGELRVDPQRWLLRQR